MSRQHTIFSSKSTEILQENECRSFRFLLAKVIQTGIKQYNLVMSVVIPSWKFKKKNKKKTVSVRMKVKGWFVVLLLCVLFLLLSLDSIVVSGVFCSWFIFVASGFCFY